MNKIFIFLLLPLFSQAQLATPRCSYVTGYTLSPLSPSDVSYWNSYVASNYPSATLLAGPTSSYNCHSYAWNMSDGGATYWVNTPDDDTYWNDGSYVEVSDHATPYATKVSYPNGDHSAITTSNSNVFISKWGVAPLMQHAPTYCPYNSSGLKYYSIPISGDRFICSGSATYTTFSSSGVSSYNWNGGSYFSPSTQTGSSNSYAITSPYNGTTAIAVSMYSSCSGTTVGGSKAVNVGNGPMMGGFYYNGGTSYPDPACVNTAGNFTVLIHPTFPAGYTLNLVWSSANCTLGGTYGTYNTVNFNGSPGSTAMVRVDAYGPCGLGENATVYMPLIDCGLPPQDWRIAPNPVKGGSGNVNIQLPVKPGKNAVLLIYDKGLVLRRQVKVTSNTLALSLAGFPSGPVYLTLVDGEKRYKQIVIKE